MTALVGRRRGTSRRRATTLEPKTGGCKRAGRGGATIVPLRSPGSNLELLTNPCHACNSRSSRLDYHNAISQQQVDRPPVLSAPQNYEDKTATHQSDRPNPSQHARSPHQKMASPASSTGSEPKKNLEQITFRFCSEW